MRPATLDPRFLSLGTPKRVWAVSAIHGDAERLTALHDDLLGYVQPGDRIIYHGNYTGYGAAPAATIDELLTFRRLVLSIPGMMADDIVYLRGGQEEMWQKLTQLQFAPNPVDILLWMLGKGMNSTLASYGLSPHDGIIAAQEGVMSLTRWTGKVREALRRRPGHDIFNTHLCRAAYTERSAHPLLFVNAGIDPSHDLEHQGDHFWWSNKDFNSIQLPYDPFHKVIRGFDPNHQGMRINCVTATIDGGCGFGGPLVCAGFDAQGEVLEILQT